MRRKFDEALTVPQDKKDTPKAKRYDFCNALFEIERRAEKMSPKERYELRQQESKLLTLQFYERVIHQLDKTLPKSLLGTALVICLKS